MLVDIPCTGRAGLCFETIDSRDNKPMNLQANQRRNSHIQWFLSHITDGLPWPATPSRAAAAIPASDNVMDIQWLPLDSRSPFDNDGVLIVMISIRSAGGSFFDVYRSRLTLNIPITFYG
jgi:hypothetical protein